jgi:hypothetical protein
MTVQRNPVAIRLGKLADAGKTGALYLSGESGGVIHLEKGEIVLADSRATPSLRTRIERAEELAGRKAVGSFERNWMAREATMDAGTELLSFKPRYVRFRELDNGPASGGTDGMSVQELVREVSRRHELFGQLSAVVAPDTPVVRNPRLKSRLIHVSDIQWAILMRLNDPAQPRTLAEELGQSVFSTTIEVFRMVVMGLVSVAGGPARSDDEAGEADRRRPAISFIRALSG